MKPFLLIDGNLGVPKKILYRIYLDALTIFADAKNSARINGSVASVARNMEAATAVILLANPAHATALNARKHLIEKQVLDCGKELKLVAGLLSSRNCSNQSIIWHHRQWLLRRIRDTKLSQSGEELGEYDAGIWGTYTTLDTELSIVALACEIYPRNYFAWAHRYFCMNEIISSVPKTTLAAVISNEISATRGWIEQHISDSSAVHYLVSLIECSSKVIDVSEHVCSLMSHAISLVQCYPDHETMWLYLRATSRLKGGNGSANTEMEEFTRMVIYPLASHSSSGHDNKLVSTHAYRFLALAAQQVRTCSKFTFDDA